jgi:hypothetical protein
MRWTNNKNQSIFFSKIEYLPWRVFNNKLMPPKVIKIDKPIRIITNDKGTVHYLIYSLNGEECIKELGRIVKIEDNDVELSVKFTRGYLSTTQKFLKDKMREVCKKMESDIDMEMNLYKRLQDAFGDTYEPNFFVNEKYRVTDRYQVFVHNMKLL